MAENKNIKNKNELLSGELKNISRREQVEMLTRIQSFMELLMHYRCAIREIETKLNVLNDEFSLQHERNPFEAIESRVKEPISIIEKMNRKGYEVTVENIEDKLSDIAGIRVICSFVEDIYYLAHMLAVQDDIRVLTMKDYIKAPKVNGYRSLHLIVEVPIFLSNQKKYMRVEVQFRTIAMDFWASLDHKIKYKKNLKNADQIVEELRKCAEVISSVDMRMQEIRNMIEEEDGYDQDDSQ